MRLVAGPSRRGSTPPPSTSPRVIGDAARMAELDLLHGDVPAGVAELKRKPGGNLVIMGSGRLIRSLLPHG